MPRSQIPAGTVHLAMAVSGLLPSVTFKTSAFSIPKNAFARDYTYFGIP